MKRLLIISAILLSACSSGTDLPQQQGDQPVQSNNNTFLQSLGGAVAGSMIGNMLSRPATPAPSTNIINRTVVIEKRVVEPPKPQVATTLPPKPVAPVVAPPRPVAAPSFRPSTPSSFRSSPSFGRR